jgi:hypothetical protein
MKGAMSGSAALGGYGPGIGASSVARAAASSKKLNKASKVASQACPSAGNSAADAMAAWIQAKLGLYPNVLDPRTGRSIPFPSGIRGPVEQSLRVSWDSKANKAAFISEWYQRGYSTPTGGWGNYDIHHILPQKFGGTNDFWNLVPVERGTHQELFNSFWREFTGL